VIIWESSDSWEVSWHERVISDFSVKSVISDCSHERYGL
jgi:hypothetical protein